MTAKSVLMHPQGLRPELRASTCPPPPCYATVDSFVESDQKM